MPPVSVVPEKLVSAPPADVPISMASPALTLMVPLLVRPAELGRKISGAAPLVADRVPALVMPKPETVPEPEIVLCAPGVSVSFVPVAVTSPAVRVIVPVPLSVIDPLLSSVPSTFSVPESVLVVGPDRVRLPRFPR